MDEQNSLATVGASEERDKDRGLASRLLSGLPLVAAFVGGLILLLTAPTLLPDGVPDWAREVQRAVGEGLVVAVLLALLIELRLRGEFARHIIRQTAALTSTDLFKKFLAGDRAPDEYVADLQSFSRVDRLGLDLQWTFTFDWQDRAKGIISLRGRSELTSQNLSSTAEDLKPLWLTNSPTGFPKNQFLHYDAVLSLETTVDGAKVLGRISLDGPQLELLAEPGLDGENVDLTKSAAHMQIPPGALFSTDWECLTFHATSGYMPLATWHPTLRQRVVVRGPALQEFNVQVRGGSPQMPWEPAPNHTTLGELVFEIPHLTLRNTIVLLSWDLREVQPKGKPDEGDADRH